MRSRFESSLDPFIFWIVFFGYCCTKCTLFTLSGITFVKIIGTLHIVKRSFTNFKNNFNL